MAYSLQRRGAHVASRHRRSSTSQWMRVYRVSEYSFDVDFLANHNAASVDAMPLYLMTCSPDGSCAPWSTTDHTKRWAACQQTLEHVCSSSRGAAFSCMQCAEKHRVALEHACGLWSAQDTLVGEGSFSIHWYCGVGWPESTAAEGPVTEYCVEFEQSPPLPQVLLQAGDSKRSLPHDGFSFYLSCNSDEVDAYGNDPRDPSCICMCLDDRLLSHETLDVLSADCFHNGECLCSGSSAHVGNAIILSAAHVLVPQGAQDCHAVRRVCRHLALGE